MRGPCPGLGAALSAFGIECGTIVAREIAARVGENEDPWSFIEAMFKNPEESLSPKSSRHIGKTLRKAWEKLPDERRSLLKLLSRFELTPEQASLIYVTEERQKAGINCTDAELLANPYRVFELTRLLEEPVSVWTVDKGVFPDPRVLEQHPLPELSCLDTGTDARRIRALSVQILEQAAQRGNTLLPRKDIILQMRQLLIQPSCDVTGDLMVAAEDDFSQEIEIVEMKDGTPAYQTKRLSNIGDVIREKINKRTTGKRLTVDEDWRKLLDNHLAAAVDSELEESARVEKTAALKELAEARFSVLIGPAGTGKTTLLSVLCANSDIASAGVLLLAPTGKARVRMEQAIAGTRIRGYTLAQYLTPDRYNVQTGHYHLSDKEPASEHRTVIVDEASMLTEEMLGSLLQSVKFAQRLILIGDPRQLPPIGSGRPFVDIVSKLKPEGCEFSFPRVSAGYAELTIRRRQAGGVREDLQLAEWFSGAPMGPAEDEVFDTVLKSGSSKHVRFVGWDSRDDVQNALIEILVDELNLLGSDDIAGFDASLGAVESNGYRYFNLGAATKADSWQILSPLRGLTYGVSELNRLIHRKFRSNVVSFAQERNRIPKPLGAEEIVYGDKIINVQNQRRRGYSQSKERDGYIANGEIGIAIGQFGDGRKRPRYLNIEFSSQPGVQYGFDGTRFSDDVDPPLELAYAVTVHKAQGSEFGTVLLVLPNPCRLLSRELLYTALTRQRNRVVILHQGDRYELKKYAHDGRSEIALRLTNLFTAPQPVEIDGKFFEDRLINRTRRGELVRSKSEVIIADRLADLGVEYSYEKELTISGVTKFPDFTIEDAESGQCYYWEHCGMLHVQDYKNRWDAKLCWYKENGILPYDQGGGPRGTLVITRDNEQGGISSQEIESVVRSVILREF